MVTRRTDARRRRVLSEEFVPTNQDAVAGDRKPMQAYSYGANRRNQPKTTDMIPKRALSLSLFFLLIAGVVAALNALAWYASPLAEVVGSSGSRAFALSGPGTLANWVCCLSLFLCSGICIQLFFLRKHKRDDYGGMYYVWLLMAGLFFVASVDCAIDLRTIFAKLFEYATQRSLLQTSWLMMTIELIVLAVIVLRMLFEVRTSRFSLAAVLLVWLGFVGCIVLRNSGVPEQLAWVDPNVAYGNCVLLGCVGSLVSLVVYARFVFLHAHGLIQLKVYAEPTAEETERPAASTKRKTTRSRKKTTPDSVTESEPASSPAPMVTTTATKKSSRSKPKSVETAPASKRRAKAKTSKPTPAPAKVRKKETATQPATLKVPTKTTAEPEASQPSEPSASSDRLQQELEQIETVSMSKSERRRQRKLAKRAARANKAA